METIRSKRSDAVGQKGKLDAVTEQLALLRDQEAILVRALEEVGAQPANRPAGPVPTPPRPTAEQKDYELRKKQIQEARSRRDRAFWGEVRKVVSHLRQNKNLATVFGMPVRETQWGQVAANWERYCQVVSEPMDLGTVKRQLGEDEAGRTYTSPHEVVKHIDRIVNNCLKFNSGASNQAVRALAGHLQTQFNKKWQDGKFDQKWQEELRKQQAESEELRDLELAAKGTIADKIRYFDNCVRRRLKEMHTPEPTEDCPFTWEQKRKLSAACSQLGEDDCYALLDIVARHESGGTGDTELVLEIGSLSDVTLFQMQRYIDSLPARPGPGRSSAQAAQPASHTPAAAEPAGQSAAATAAAPTSSAVPATDAAGTGNGGAAGNSGSGAMAGRAHTNGYSNKRQEPPAASHQSGESDSSANSSSSNSSSSSGDTDDDAASNPPSGPRASSADSKQAESAHGNDSEGKQNGREGSRGAHSTPAGEEKPAPAILKADDSHEVEVENEDDWAVPEDEAAAEDGEAAMEDGELPKDPLWESSAREAAQQHQKDALESAVKDEVGNGSSKKRSLESQEPDKEVATAAQPPQESREEREAKRRKALESKNNPAPGVNDEELVVGV